MAEERIYTIRLEHDVEVTSREGVDTETVTTNVTQEAQVDKLSKEARSGKSLALSMAAQYGKQIAGYALSNYGNLTGDYVTQRTITEGINLIGTAASIIANPVLGTISTMLNVGTQIADIAIQNKAINKQAEFLRERTQTMNK